MRDQGVTFNDMYFIVQRSMNKVGMGFMVQESDRHAASMPMKGAWPVTVPA